MKKTVVFDFDGVIHSYTSGWKGITEISDPPVDGIREVIIELRKRDYEVVIVSTRCSEIKGIVAIENYLKKNDIVVDKICSEKPPAIVYVDDRAINFDGKIYGLLDKICNFKSWTEKLKEEKE